MEIIKPIGEAWGFLKSNPKTFAPGILSAIVAVLSSWSFSLLEIQPNLSSIISFFLILGAVVLVSVLVNSYVSVWIVSIINKKGKTSLSASASDSLKLFPIAIGSAILYSLISFGGLILLVIPGIYLMIRFLFYEQAIVIDKSGVTGSLSKSWDLTRNKWWSTFALLLVLGIIVFVLSLPGAIISLVGFFLGMSSLSIVSSIYSILLTIFTVPFLTAASTFYYYQLKKEKPKKK